jgi:hypothetical protein
MKGMDMAENSKVSKKSARLLDVGRIRKRQPGEKGILSFQVEEDLLTALDNEATRLTAERGPGASKVSRSEMVKVILAKWLAERSKSRQ